MKLKKIIILTITITLLLTSSVVYMEPVDQLEDQQDPITAEEPDGEDQVDVPVEDDLVPSQGEEDENGPDGEGDSDTSPELEDDIETPEPVVVSIDSMKKVAENSYLELYFADETAEAAVKVKKTGKVWYTNPPTRAGDPIAGGTNVNRLNSQLLVDYYNPVSQPSSYNSYGHSVSLDQFELIELEDGFRVEYRIGEEETLYILPKVISKTRMEEAIIANLEEGDGKSLLRYYSPLTYETASETQKQMYPNLEEEDIYVVSDRLQEFRKRSLEELVIESGYTLDDMNEDHVANGVSAEDPNVDVFFIPLEYRLDGEQLVVRVPTEEIEYDESYPIATIHVLPYFGAAGTDEEGYMLVPDGSGSLIYLNNNKRHAQVYGTSVYGSDRAIPRTVRTSLVKQTHLPVYGLKSGDNAFFSIIEKGDAMANIRADISGRLNSYNFVYSNYSLVPRDELDIGNYSGLNTIAVYQPRAFIGDIQIRYGFLDGDQANYSGMAKYYRSYLEGQGFERNEQDDKVPFYLETIGAINKVRSILGIPVNTTQPLTTYEQTIDIMDQLGEGGIDNIVLKYTG
ncbi:MAG TPA: DUF5696 domain-containing protein, partial [Bacillota bacterium]|nr:DUF5696 domain-containing protein [Bacillota bacterium]